MDFARFVVRFQTSPEREQIEAAVTVMIDQAGPAGPRGQRDQVARAAQPQAPAHAPVEPQAPAVEAPLQPRDRAEAAPVGDHAIGEIEANPLRQGALALQQNADHLAKGQAHGMVEGSNRTC